MNPYLVKLREKTPQMEVIISSVSVLIENAEGQLLLQKRTWTKDWGLIGGSCEIGDSYTDTVIKEIYEEAGLKLDKNNLRAGATNEHINVYPNGDKNFAYEMVFHIKIDDQAIDDCNDESLALEFFDVNHLPDDMKLVKAHAPVVKRFNELKKERFTRIT